MSPVIEQLAQPRFSFERAVCHKVATLFNQTPRLSGAVYRLNAVRRARFYCALKDTVGPLPAAFPVGLDP